MTAKKGVGGLRASGAKALRRRAALLLRTQRLGEGRRRAFFPRHTFALVSFFDCFQQVILNNKS